MGLQGPQEDPGQWKDPLTAPLGVWGRRPIPQGAGTVPPPQVVPAGPQGALHPTPQLTLATALQD